MIVNLAPDAVRHFKRGQTQALLLEAQVLILKYPNTVPPAPQVDTFEADSGFNVV